MRTLLVVNPFATSTSGELREEIVEMLDEKLSLTVKVTTRASDATKFASTAQSEGFELVISLGGDGTLNEIANGVLQDPGHKSNPIIAAIPGGNANVFVRNIGWPKSPLAACAQILDSVEQNKVKTIGVGRATTASLSRYFLFNCGIGLDAAVLARMQNWRASGRRATDVAYTGLALHELLVRTNRKEPQIEVRDFNGTPLGKAHLALIINLAPWTYLGELALPLTPEATLDTALDVFAAKELTLSGISRLIRRAIRTETENHDVSFITMSNQESASFVSTEQMWVQVDGEVLERSQHLDVEYLPGALRILV